MSHLARVHELVVVPCTYQKIDFAHQLLSRDFFRWRHTDQQSGFLSLLSQKDDEEECEAEAKQKATSRSIKPLHHDD